MLYLETNNALLKQFHKLTKTQFTFIVRTFLISNEKLKQYLLTQIDLTFAKSFLKSFADEISSSKTFYAIQQKVLCNCGLTLKQSAIVHDSTFVPA